MGLQLSRQALLCAALLVSVGCGPNDDSQPRNLVLIVVDTLRADHTSLHGYDRATTPYLDAFAVERGVVFEQARSSSPWTKPSVASIFTGLDPRQHRVLKHNDTLHSSFESLAAVFQASGWQTHGVQSNPYLLSLFGFDAGFESYADDFAASSALGTIATHDESTGASVNARSLEWLDARKKQQPFFLYVHHYEPHHMYLEAEPSFLPPDTAEPDGARREGLAAATMDALVAGTSQLTPADVAYLAGLYDSEVLLQDRLLHELFEGLRARELFENTVVVVTSDHGEEFVEHGDVSHHNDKLFDELLHVPLVIAAPGIAAKRRDDGVGLADLGRTLLDLCGLKTTAFPGASFAKQVHGEGRFNFPAVAHGLLPPSALKQSGLSERESVVSGDWKLIRDLTGGGTSLYNLAVDPGELSDQSAQEEARCVQLAMLIDNYLERRGGIGPELPPESAELQRRQEEKFKELQEVLSGLGY